MSDRPSAEELRAELLDAFMEPHEYCLSDLGNLCKKAAERLEELSAPGKTQETTAQYIRRLNEENLALAEKVKELSTTATGICAYCGEVFQGDRTETTAAFVNHVTTCPSHPLASALKTIDELKEKVKALEAEEVGVECQRCDGKGTLPGLSDGYQSTGPIDCYKCHGTGKVLARRAK